MARRRREKLPKGPKKVSYELIREDNEMGGPMYALLRELVAAHHDELIEARIALAWNTSWKADVDGRVTLGKCKKASDLDRELSEFDFIILLRREFWLYATDAHKRALLDHELCHAQIKLDKETGEPEYDERGRKVYRIRKHDIEEFTEIVDRHGLWKRDLEYFARAIKRATPQAELPLDPDSAGADAADPRASDLGRQVIDAVTDVNQVQDNPGINRLQRLAKEDGAGEMTLTTDDGQGGRKGIRITKDGVTDIKEPARA